jgi:sensor histidine kinase YesM
VHSRGPRTEIVVADNGPGVQAGITPIAGIGIGLGNLRERLGLLYGSSAELQVDSSAIGNGTTVRILLPGLVAVTAIPEPVAG